MLQKLTAFPFWMGLVWFVIVVSGTFHEDIRGNVKTIPLTTISTSSTSSSETSTWCRNLLEEKDVGEYFGDAKNESGAATPQNELYLMRLRAPAIEQEDFVADFLKPKLGADETAMHAGTVTVMVSASALKMKTLLAEKATNGLARRVQLVCPLLKEHKVHQDLHSTGKHLVAEEEEQAGQGPAAGGVDHMARQICIKGLTMSKSHAPIKGLYEHTAVDRTHNQQRLLAHERHFSAQDDISHGSLTSCCPKFNKTCIAVVAAHIAAIPAVYFVEGFNPVLNIHNMYSRGIMESGKMFEEPLGDLGLEGKGHVVGIADTGIDYDHCFFYDEAFPNLEYDKQMPKHRKIIRYNRVTPSVEASKNDFREGHGTHVCGTVAGYTPETSHDSYRFHGIVPQAKISFTDLSGYSNEGVALPPSLKEVFNGAYSDGARIHSNSWGGQYAAYSANAQEVDLYMTERPDMLILFSAGNEADKNCVVGHENDLTCDRHTVTSPSTSKNCISVGASMAPQESWERASYGNFLMNVRANNERKTFVSARADFGPKDVGDGLANMTSVWTEPIDSCNTITNDIRGKVAVTWRGTCHFEDKAARIQAAGGLAMVVVNNEEGDAFTMGSTQDAGKGEKGVHIPCFMIGRKDGETMIGWLKAGLTVFTSIFSTSKKDIHKNEENLSSFSSHGPTSDNRYKPDLVAIGEFIHSAFSDADLGTRNCDLWPSMGTSMSCPLVAGTATLLREYMLRGFYATGSENSGPSVNPNAALLKAMLIHSSTALRGLYDRNTQADWRSLGPVPSFEQGHGRPTLNHTIPIGNQSTVRFFFDQSSSVGSGEEKTYCVSHIDGTTGFRAALTWIDPAASPGITFTLINNLDLQVITPDGYTYNGNQHYPNTAGTDVVNNLEKVNIAKENTPKGSYIVRVRGTHVQNGKQTFALVTSGSKNASCTSHCEGKCGAYGECQDSGFCKCIYGYTGAFCNIPIETMSFGEIVTVTLLPMEWKYIRIAGLPANKHNFHLTYVSVQSDGDPDLFVFEHGSTLGSLPTLKNHADAVKSDTTCDPCGATGPTASRKPKTMDFPSTGSDVLVAVIGMCCYNATMRMHLTNAMTATNSIYGAQWLDVESNALTPAKSVLSHLPISESLIGQNNQEAAAGATHLVLHGRFAGDTEMLSIMFGRNPSRDEIICTVQKKNASVVICEIEDFPADIKNKDVFAMRIEKTVELVSFPSASTFSLYANFDGPSSPTAAPVTPAPLGIPTAPLPPGGQPPTAPTGMPTAHPAPEHGAVVGLAARHCPVSGECETKHHMLFPPTLAINGKIIIATNITVSAVQASALRIFLVDRNSSIDTTIEPYKTYPCTVQTTPPAKSVTCVIPSSATGAHQSEALPAGHTFTLRIGNPDGSVEDVPLSTAAIYTMETTTFSGLLMGGFSAQPPTLTQQASAVASLSLPVTYIDGGFKLFLVGNHFNPHEHFGEGDVILSEDFAHVMTMHVVGSPAVNGKIISNTVIAFEVPKGTGAFRFPANTDIPVLVSTFEYSPVPHNAHYSLMFSAASHVSTIVGTYDASKNATLTSYTITILGEYFPPNPENVSISLQPMDVTENSFPCNIEHLDSQKIVCQPPTTVDIPAGPLFTLRLLINEHEVHQGSVVFSGERTMIHGIGTSLNGPRNLTEVYLPANSGDEFNEVGPELFLFGTNFPLNETGGTDWQIALLPTADKLNPGDPHVFSCLAINATTTAVRCRASPYGFGRRELRVTMPGSVVSVLTTQRMLVHFNNPIASEEVRQTSYLLKGNPVIYETMSYLTVALPSTLPADVILSSTNCAHPTPLQQANGISSRFISSQIFMPNETASYIWVCAARLRIQQNYFFFGVFPTMRVWYFTSVLVQQKGRQDYLVEQGDAASFAAISKPRIGFVAPLPVSVSSTLLVSFSMYNNGRTPQKDPFHVSFSIQKEDTCNAESSSFLPPVPMALDPEGKVSLLRHEHVLSSKHNQGHWSLCAKIKTKNGHESGAVALMRFKVSQCVAKEDCNNNGECVPDPSDKNVMNCQCNEGFGSVGCIDSCPMTVPSTAGGSGGGVTLAAEFCGGASRGTCRKDNAQCACTANNFGSACQHAATPAPLPLNYSVAFPKLQPLYATIPHPLVDLPYTASPSAVGGGSSTAGDYKNLLVATLDHGSLGLGSLYMDVLLYTSGATDGKVHSAKVPVSYTLFLWHSKELVGDLTKASDIIYSQSPLHEGVYSVERLNVGRFHCYIGECFLGILVNAADEMVRYEAAGASQQDAQEAGVLFTKDNRNVVLSVSLALKESNSDPLSQPTESTGLPKPKSELYRNIPDPDGGKCKQDCIIGSTFTALLLFLVIVVGGTIIRKKCCRKTQMAHQAIHVDDGMRFGRTQL